MTDKISIPISREIYEAIKQKVEAGESGFSDVVTYIEFVLKELTRSTESEMTKDESMTSKDEEILKQRLKKLGYE